MSKLLDTLHAQMVRNGLNPYGGTLSMEVDRGEFSVYWWDASGGQHEESRFVGIKTVEANVTRLTKGPAATMGMIDRVMVTDGGDHCCFDWNKRDGIVFPTEEDL